MTIGRFKFVVQLDAAGDPEYFRVVVEQIDPDGTITGVFGEDKDLPANEKAQLSNIARSARERWAPTAGGERAIGSNLIMSSGGRVLSDPGYNLLGVNIGRPGAWIARRLPGSTDLGGSND